jgi:hypothetical protein
VITPGILPVDTDGDGMPDYWKLALGLSLTNGADALTAGTGGYTKLENYLNWLAAPNAVTGTNTPVNVDLTQYTGGFTNASPVYSVFVPVNGTVALQGGHTAQFTPAPGFFGLGSFNFSVVASDGTTMTNTVTVCVTPTNAPQSQTTPVLETAPTAPAITYGQALSNSVLSGGAFTNAAGTAVPGTFAFTTPSATPGAGAASQLVTFTPNDTNDYNTPATFSVSVTVNPLAVILTGTRAYDGTTNAAFGILSVSNAVAGDNVTVASGSGGLAVATVGTNSITSLGGLALGGTAAGNYTLTGAGGSVIITQAVSSTTLASSQNPSRQNGVVTFTATVTGADTPTGTVQFLTNGAAFDTETLSNGAASSVGTALLPVGTNTITGAYSGNGNYLASTNNLGQVVVVVNPQFSPISIGASGLVMSGSGGLANGPYYILTSTNIGLPLSQWTPLLTNQFDNNGNFNVTNTLNTNAPQDFYLLQLP